MLGDPDQSERPDIPPPVVAVRRPVLAAAIAAGSLVTLWAVGLTGYLCFQDEIAAVLLRRQAEMQYAYEAQIGGLKAQIERTTTQALVERQRLDGRISGLIARQAEIDARQAALAALAERTIGPAAPVAPTFSPSPSPEARGTPEPGRLDRMAKPTPLSDASTARVSDRPQPAPLDRNAIADKLSRLEQAIGRADAEQARAVDALTRTARSWLAFLDGAISGIGLDPSRLDPPREAAPEGGIGGPLVPLPLNSRASSFDISTGELQATIVQFGRLRQIARSLPLTRPVSGTLEPSSPFGTRVDPFTRAAALHTGVDLRAEYGTEVRATGPGRVTVAEASGGYGNMIEIDHGNDVVTRYAHLSIIGVTPGRTVAAGEVIGHVGSTGRSTGAHLHYETRIGGEPVNPQRFLQAGAQLASVAPSRLR